MSLNQNMSATVVTVRYLVDDVNLKDFVHQIENDAKHHEFCMDYTVVQTHLPLVIEDSIVNETYNEGDFAKPLHIMVRADGPNYMKPGFKGTTEHPEDAGIFHAWDLPNDLMPWHYMVFAK